MDTADLELYLVIQRFLGSSPWKQIAESLKQELKKVIDDTRLDFLGNKHQRDLNNLLARYPSLNFTNVLLAQEARNWLNSAGSVASKNQPYNVLKCLQSRKIRGPLTITQTIPTQLYSRIVLHRRLMGHLSSAYCVCFDQTGQFVFTGADDHLIKIWCSRTGRLLKTLRGHDGHICDMSVSYDNKLLASVGSDRVIRIWDLKSTKLLECATSQSAQITSIKFAPYNRHGNVRYLVSTSNDGTVVFWSFDANKFESFPKKLKRLERNKPGGQITCSSFSTGGSFLACGSSDNYIHVYGFTPQFGPYPFKELEQHTKEVDSVQFCNRGFRFISGSKDGTAIIWTYKRNDWRPIRLNMSTQLDQTIAQPLKGQTPPTVLIVQWSRDDRYVMTSLVDYSIKVWDSHTGILIHILKEHKHDVYLIESHPTDPRIFASASHDGSLIIWDITKGVCINKIWSLLDPRKPPHAPQNTAAILDFKFSPDGTMLATTDSYGYLGLYGYGSSELYQKLPEEMFFNTDYRPLIRDFRHFGLDENTHMAPHLMPRPQLVNMNGNPHDRSYQSLVPDYRNGEGTVVPPLSASKLSSIAKFIEDNSKAEDDEFLAQKLGPNLDYSPDFDYSSDNTIIDSDNTEIGDYDVPATITNPVSYQHELRSRSYGEVRNRERARERAAVRRADERRFSARLRHRKRVRLG